MFVYEKPMFNKISSPWLDYYPILRGLDKFEQKLQTFGIETRNLKVQWTDKVYTEKR